MGGWEVDRSKKRAHNFNMDWSATSHASLCSTVHSSVTMSSPRSAPPSSDITRQHTPAADGGGGSAASENGDDAAAGNGEEQLPEKVRIWSTPTTTVEDYI